MNKDKYDYLKNQLLIFIIKYGVTSEVPKSFFIIIFVIIEYQKNFFYFIFIRIYIVENFGGNVSNLIFSIFCNKSSFSISLSVNKSNIF